MSSTPFIFISYSHKDSEWLEEFKIQLKPYLRNIDLQIWDDQQIEVGAKWREEIEQALASATVAVLLVSPAFLASNFIHNEEIPKLLKAEKERGLVVFWIPVRASSFEETQIVEYQSAHPPNQPIARMRPEDRDDAWVKICKKLGEVLRRQQAKQAPPQPAVRNPQNPTVRPSEVTEHKTQSSRLTPIPTPIPIPVPTPAPTPNRAPQPPNRSSATGSARPIPFRSSVPQQWTRQRFLKWAGLDSAGLITAVVGSRELFKNTPPTIEPSPSVVEPSPSTSKPSSLQSFNFEVVTVDAKGQNSNRQSKQAEFFADDLGNGITLEMVKIPGGSFKMGSPDTELGRYFEESPQHYSQCAVFFHGQVCSHPSSVSADYGE